MVESTTTADYCRIRISDLFLRESVHQKSLVIPKDGRFYESGASDATLYFIECGQVRLLLPTGSRRNYLVATRNAGDFFGESCLSGEHVRRETAVAAQETAVRAMSRRSFLSSARREYRLVDVMRYLAILLAEAQSNIAALSSGSEADQENGPPPVTTPETTAPECEANQASQLREKERP